MAKVNDHQGKQQPNGNRGCDSWDETPKRDKFPQRFTLYGQTIDGERFSMGANVVRRRARAKVVIRDVVEDGILYRTGLRDGDILKSANGIPVKEVDLRDLVDMISKLNAFYFVLRRRCLGRGKRYSYIHINFNAETECSDSPDSDEQNDNDKKRQVTTKCISSYFGVSQDEDTYVTVKYVEPGIYRRVNGTPHVRARIDVSGVGRFLNTDGTDSSVQFTTNEVTLTQHVYVNASAQSTAIVLCPPTTTKTCLQADKDKNLFVGRLGELKNSYITLDERFLIEEAINIKLVKLESYETPGYYVTVAGDLRGVMSKTGSQNIEFLPPN